MTSNLSKMNYETAKLELYICAPEFLEDYYIVAFRMNV